MLIVNSRLQIPLSEFEFTYVRSSGPGGQNVNKVNSKALLRWPVRQSPSLTAEVAHTVLACFASRLTNEGELLISSQRYRDQGRNAEDCLEKLRVMVAEVAVRPVTRRKTRPTKASKERRLEGKREAASKKQLRRRPARED